MGSISLVKETLGIISEKEYTLSGKVIKLPEDYDNVIVYSPEAGQELLSWDISEKFQDKNCDIKVENADSFQAARKYENPFVMNFANAHKPGGGFLMGANAQEESLCKCSTLYSSIASDTAKEMYRYNNTHLSNVESDYMLLSPNVYIFRNEHFELMEDYAKAGVITIPAPNRFGAAMFASGKTIEETMIRRIRIMLRIAAKQGYKNLILGAWGCGAFGNDAKKVAQYFKSIILDEKYGRCFDEICFAIYGKPDGKNIMAFRNIF